MAQIWHTITQKGLNAARWCGAMEGHRRAFEFFGGVPRRISYDKSKIAVSKIIGRRQRRLTREFLRLKSHSLFGSRFWLVRRPDEKGQVECLLGYARRNFLVPVPRGKTNSASIFGRPTLPDRDFHRQYNLYALPMPANDRRHQ